MQNSYRKQKDIDKPQTCSIELPTHTFSTNNPFVF